MSDEHGVDPTGKLHRVVWRLVVADDRVVIENARPRASLQLIPSSTIVPNPSRSLSEFISSTSIL
jgi:hypothetical protein